jgi:hypothetical protein
MEHGNTREIRPLRPQFKFHGQLERAQGQALLETPALSAKSLEMGDVKLNRAAFISEAETTQVDRVTRFL